MHIVYLARHVAALKMNEPNHTIKLRNAGMQFVALRSLEAALHVIKGGWNACATTVLQASGRRNEVLLGNQGTQAHNLDSAAVEC